MVFIYLFIFIIIFFILFFYYLNRKIELFSNKKDCDNFFSKNSFCVLNVDKNICSCKFQKDNVKYGFDSPENCCEENCNKIPLKDCVQKNNFTKIPYYCNIGGKCVKYEGTIVDSHIMANNCGIDPLNNQLLLPYASYDECSKSINVCDKYNIPDKSTHLNQSECLKDVNCGFCTNDSGEGKCIEGNATNPTDLERYFYCDRNAKNDVNKYIYGDHSAALLQSANISSFSNVPS
jgi:hypothetical protein